MNTVNLVGRLATDPRFSEATDDTNPRAWFVLATDKPQTNTADFVPVTCFGRTAECVAEHLNKGRQVAVIAHLQASSWRDGEQTRRSVDVIADRIEFLGRRRLEEKEIAAGEVVDEAPH